MKAGWAFRSPCAKFITRRVPIFAQNQGVGNRFVDPARGLTRAARLKDTRAPGNLTNRA